MQLKEFTEPECDYFRKTCNFTPEEKEVFELRIRGCSIVETYIRLNTSESSVNRRIKSIKKKIIRVL